jgi:hypothetical protein
MSGTPGYLVSRSSHLVLAGDAMNSRSHRSLIATLALCALAGCSKDSAVAADTPTAAKPADVSGDPCALITDAEVRKSFAGAKSGVWDHSTDKYDIHSCSWDTPDNAFVAQIYKADGPIEGELRSRGESIVDPLKPDAAAKFRYEKVSGIGDEAMLVVEKRGANMYNDLVVFVTRRGDRIALLFAHSLIDDDRDATVKALQTLGKRAADRL